MVLAAGAGTRLDPLTIQLPKPLVPVANRPVMDYILNLLREHNFEEVWANLYHLPSLIEEYFGSGSAYNIQLNYLKEKSLSGDAGGVRACRQHLEGEAFLVIMGDLLTDADLSYVYAQHKAKGALATVALKRVEDVSQFGVAVLDKEGWIKEFQEKPDPKEAKSNLASTGIYVIEPSVFNYIPTEGSYGFGKQLFPQLVAKNERVLGIEIDNYWSDVGTFEQYRQANFDLLAGKMKNVILPSARGKNAQIDSSSVVEGKLLLGSNCTIGRGVKIIGNVIIGDNCSIEEGSIIKDSVIWSNSCVHAHAEVHDSVVGLSSNIASREKLNKTAFVPPSHLTVSGCSL